MDSYVVSACIAFSGVFLSIIGSYVTTERLQTKKINADKKISERNIDVNLKAKARIEWIQSVRIAASELISSYSISLIYKADNISEFMEKRNEIQLKNNILILYFGNDTKSKKRDDEIFFDKTNFQLVVKKKLRVKLLDLNNNQGKNDSLVRYLSVLKEYYDFYVESYSYSSYVNLINRRNCLENEMNSNQDEPYLEYDEEGEIIGFLGYSRKFDKRLDESLKSQIEQIDKELRQYSMPDVLNEELVFLTNVFRTYLKTEWKLAKKGK